MSVLTRRVGKVVGAGAASSLLVAGMSASAVAATPAFPHVSVAAAKATLPTAKSLPGGVTLALKPTVAPKAIAIPCETAPKVVVLAGAKSVGAVYANPTTDDNSPKNLLWHISVAVFTTPAQAKAATDKLNAAQKSCPKTKTTTQGSDSETLTRTLATKYTVGAWTGYRTISHITGTGVAAPLHGRDFTFYLTQGNVIVSVEELAPELPGTGPKQDAWRKTVTKLVLARVAKA